MEWAQRLCPVVLWLVTGPTDASSGSESAPVLVGYVKKLAPDKTGGDREAPLERAQVGMKGTGNTVDSDVHGLFRLQLLRMIRPGQSIEVEVSGVPGWVLYQPADGRLVVPESPQTVTLRLLPKGSLRFLEHEGLASLIARMMSEAKDRLRSASANLGRQAAMNVPPPVDLKGPMQKWASEYGLSLEQVQSAVDKWAKEVLAQRQKDDESVCLAHYSQKDFEQAATCFDALGQDDVQELERLKAETLERTEQVVRRFSQAADAYESRYDFVAALKEYEKADRWAKREVSSSLWAEVQVWIGMAHSQLGIRGEGEASRQHLAQAVAAYRAALQVYTRQELPQDWAATQNNLGTALSDQASRTQGPAVTTLLSQAVAAYRAALEVYTRKDLPQDWASTQNNLGTALSDQASRLPSDSPVRKDLLVQAVDALRAALEIRTWAAFPNDWVQTERNLIRACELLSDSRCVADGYVAFLVVAPDTAALYGEAYVRYHEQLFLFAEAHALNALWLSRHPTDLAVLTNFIESHLTTGRWAELSVLFANVFPKVPPSQQVPLLAIETAALTAQNRIIEAAQKRRALRNLIAVDPSAFPLPWSFGGTRHYLQTELRMAPHRQKLLALLTALEQPSRDAILTALDACCMDAAK